MQGVDVVVLIFLHNYAGLYSRNHTYIKKLLLMLQCWSVRAEEELSTSILPCFVKARAVF